MQINYVQRSHNDIKHINILGIISISLIFLVILLTMLISNNIIYYINFLLCSIAIMLGTFGLVLSIKGVKRRITSPMNDYFLGFGLNTQAIFYGIIYGFVYGLKLVLNL